MDATVAPSLPSDSSRSTAAVARSCLVRRFFCARKPVITFPPDMKRSTYCASRFQETANLAPKTTRVHLVYLVRSAFRRIPIGDSARRGAPAAEVLALDVDLRQDAVEPAGDLPGA